MTYILSIANEKGGVAKTTTSISLGASLVETGASVLLIDLDAQANLTLALGVDMAQIKQSIVNVLLESLPAAQAIIRTGIPKLDVIPSTSEMGMTERFLPMRTGYETALKKAFARKPGLMTTSSSTAPPSWAPSPPMPSPPATCCSCPPRQNSSPSTPCAA